MPNGRPGDHPYTDIVVHGDDDLFTEHIRTLFREIHDYDDGGAERIGYTESYAPADDPKAVAEVEATLEALCRELERASEYEADSPLEAALTGEDVYDEAIRDLIAALAEAADASEFAASNRCILSSVLWQAGWEPDDLEALESELCDCREQFH